MAFTDSVGYLGTLVYLANHAYISLSARHSDRVYFAANMIAALALVVTSAALHSWQSMVTNLFWAGVSLRRLCGGSIYLPSGLQAWTRPIAAICLVLALAGLAIGFEVLLASLAWISVVLFAGVYLLFAADRLQKRQYLWLNVLAALLILPQLWLDTNYPVFLLESIWAILSFVGAVRMPRTSAPIN